MIGFLGVQVNKILLKKVSFFKSMRFNKLVALILVFVAVATEPYILLFAVFSIYVVSGPVLSLLLHHQATRIKEEAQIDKRF